MASGSRGGSNCHAATWASSATKKLYMCLEMNLAVASCLTIMSMTCSPVRLPLWPRNDFSQSSCWSSLNLNLPRVGPVGLSESTSLCDQPVNASAALLDVLFRVVPDTH